MKIIDIKVDVDQNGKNTMELVGETNSYVITEFDEDFQCSLNSMEFIYFTKLGFDDSKLFFWNKSILIGVIHCHTTGIVDSILCDNLDKFNKEN